MWHLTAYQLLNLRRSDCSIQEIQKLVGWIGHLLWLVTLCSISMESQHRDSLMPRWWSGYALEGPDFAWYSADLKRWMPEGLRRVEAIRREVLCLVILICFSASTSAYSSLSVIEMIFAAVLFVFYMCDLHSKISFINWPWTDFFRALIAAILYLITSIVVLVEGKGSSKIAAGVLGIFATLLFGCDAYFTFPLKQQRHTAAPTDPTDGP
ncbi:hypothetical protein STEG23_009962 [Scotinomys teguina]